MSYRHNQVQLTGRVAAAPDLHFASDGTPRARLYLLQDRGGEGPPNRFVLIGWSSLARRLHEVVRSRDRLFVQGELRTRSFVSEGINQIRTEVHLEQFVLLKSPRSERRLAEARNQGTIPSTSRGISGANRD